MLQKVKHWKDEAIRALRWGFVAATIIYGAYLVFFLLLPFGQDLIFGHQIVDGHARLVAGNRTGSTELATVFSAWASQNITSYYNVQNASAHFCGFGCTIYLKKDGFHIFERSPILSWIITSRAGNCQESAYYFASMMQHFGFPAWFVCTKDGDHCWSQYVDEKGHTITIDPSANRIIEDIREFAYEGNRSWGYVESYQLNWSAQNETGRYLETGTVKVSNQTSSILSPISKVYLLSPYLKETLPSIYPNNFETATLPSSDSAIAIGKGKYIAETFIDFGLFWLKNDENMSIQAGKEVRIIPNYVITEKTKNEWNLFTVCGLIVVLVLIFKNKIKMFRQQLKLGKSFKP